MPTTSQLVRKGRVSPKKKLATPGLKSGSGRKKKVAAPQRRGAHPAGALGGARARWSCQGSAGRSLQGRARHAGRGRRERSQEGALAVRREEKVADAQTRNRPDSPR